MSTGTRLAIDIGNSRVKLGLFGAARSSRELPGCLDRAALPIAGPDLIESLRSWLLARAEPDEAWVGSVNPPLLARILDQWPRERDAPRLADRSSVRFPANLTRSPERVGTDRLFNAVAANRLRASGQPAVVIDSGTATKVDFVDAQGAFRGGAILAGFELIANTLHEKTAQLPRLDLRDMANPPEPVGVDTESALRSGMYWGQVGGVRELVGRIAEPLETPPLILLTGGAASLLVPHLPDAVDEENLTMQGILLAANK